MLLVKDVRIVEVVPTSVRLLIHVRLSKELIVPALDMRIVMEYVYADSRLHSGMVDFAKHASLLVTSILLYFNA